MTHEAMLAGITRELVKTEIQIHAQNPEMALGMAMARRIMERQYATTLEATAKDSLDVVKTR